jgi:uncharacterized membrane protein YdjX (TVP38/TMEM64 family)
MSDDEKSPFKFREAEGHESISDLVRELADQGSHLAQQQTSLLQAEVRAAIDDLKVGIGAMAGAAVVGIAGVGVLLMAIAYLLGTVMPLWLGTLIVAAATLAGACFLFLSAQKKMQSSSLSVERTRRTLERAPQAIAGQKNEGRSHER